MSGSLDGWATLRGTLPTPSSPPADALAVASALGRLPPAEADGLPGVEGAPASVLLVDDNPDNLLALQAVLEPLGLRLVTADSGEAALRHLLQEDFAVVLLDIQMGGMSGLETAAYVRQRERNRATPLIFLTAYDRTQAELVAGYAQGAVDYLVKPLDPTVLRAKVGVLVELHQARRLAQAQAELLGLQRQHAQLVARRTAEHLARLKLLAASLTAAASPEDVGEVVLRASAEALEAQAVTLSLLDEGGRTLRAAAVQGVAVEVPGVLPLELASPLTDAARLGLPVVLESADVRERLYPGLPLADGMPRGAWACLPLVVEGRVLGALGLAWAAPRDFEPSERDLLGALSQLCAQALERARLYAAERALRAEERVRAQFEGQLIGIVSHDLRNPLTVIRMGMAQLRGAGLADAERRVADRVGRAADRAHRLIHDLLDFTQARRTGSLSVQRQVADVHGLARTVAEELLVAHPGRRIDVVAEGPGAAEVDPDRVAQVLTNLVGNALAYSPEDAAVRLCTRGGAEGVELEVHNTGAPIPPALLPHLFEPLTRGDGAASSERSIGLGLFIVRHVVQAHGGRVSVHSTEADGTTFRVWLPR